MIDIPTRDLTVCWKCGAKALPGQEFADGSRAGQVLCPECQQRVTRQFGQTMLAGAVIIAVGGGLLAWLGKGDDQRAGWVTLNLGIGWIMGLFLTLPHELAHAAVAGIFRHRIKRIVVGYGAPLLRINAGFPIEWRLVPLGGFCEHLAPDGRRNRSADFWISAAGPLSHLVMGLGAWMLAGRPGFSEFDPTRGLALLWMFIGWNAASFFWNTLPSMATIEGSARVPNDGMCMLLSLRKTPEGPALGEPVPQDTRRRVPLSTRLGLWGIALAGIIAAIQQLGSGVEGEPLSRSATLTAIGCLLISALCIRAAFYFEDLANQPPPSRRIAAGTSVHEGFREMIRRELAALPRGEGAHAAALDAALRDVAIFAARKDWAAVIERTDEAIRDAGPHIALLLGRAEALTQARRDEEAHAAWAALYDADGAGPAVAACAVQGFAITGVLTNRIAAVVTRVEEYAAFEQSTPARLYALDHAARCAFIAPCPELAPHALRWTAELLEAAPANPVFRAVDGIVRVVAGQVDQAVPELENVLHKSEDTTAKGLASYGLHLAARARSDEPAAARHLARARLLVPDEPWLTLQESRPAPAS